MSRSIAQAAAAAASLLALTGCGGGTPTGAGGGEAATVRVEDWCDRPGMTAALRQTVLIVDDRAVRRVGSPAEFRGANPDLQRLVVAFSDPAEAVRNGIMAPRERLTVLLTPAGGGAPRQVFTGCAPGVSATEAAAEEARRGGLQNLGDSAFGRDVNSEANTASEAFGTGLLAAVARLGLGAPLANADGGLASGGLVRSMQAAPQLAQPEHGMVRAFVFTDLNSFGAHGDAVSARRAGLAAAQASRLRLGGVEIHVVGPGGGANGREFAHAFWLGSQGRLAGWGGAGLSGLAQAPTRVETYVGTIRYPSPSPMRVQLAIDARGRLVNSWVTISTDVERMTPLTGQADCNPADRCRIASDNGGFAQVWSDDPDDEPEWSEQLPLSGLRGLRATLTGRRLEGEIFDPGVEMIGSTPTLPFTLERSA